MGAVMWKAIFVLTCHQLVFQEELFDDVIRHQLGAVYDGVACNVRQTA